MISTMAKPLALVVVVIFFFSACQSREEKRMANPPDMNQAIAALRDAYAAFNRGDMNAAVASLDADIEWIEAAGTTLNSIPCSAGWFEPLRRTDCQPMENCVKYRR